MPNFSGSKGSARPKRERIAVGPVRLSQLITTFGPGAIVELPDYTVLLDSADSWYRFRDRKPFELHDPNLEHLLDVDGFFEPPHEETHDAVPTRDIAARRFPAYHFCPTCGDLKRFWEFPGGKTCRNNHASTRILPSRFVSICAGGHLDEFPYSWWVHNGHPETCKGTGYNLRLEFSDATEGLAGIRVVCKDCGASRTMANSLGKGPLRGHECRGRRPWIHGAEDVECDCEPIGALRTATTVYLPITQSALTIPPWSTKLQQYLSQCWDMTDAIRAHVPESVLASILQEKCNELAQPGEQFSLEDVLEAIRVRDRDVETFDADALRRDEYKVLSAGDYQAEDDLHFRTSRSEVPEEFSHLISDLVLVNRLREVLALEGFQRTGMSGRPMPPGNPYSRWLPAIEMLGEGFFVRLNEEAVWKWEERAQDRYLAMNDRLSDASNTVHTPTMEFSPRYVLLHTLSHLLIRQLALESGYNAASIKERIYSSDDPVEPMAGILLYTSTSDADGSLGGLVRRGQKELFAQTLQSALDEAVWCSADPVCAESTAQGFNALNYAACHACTLLPETSCEVRNCLLDRAAVIGTPEDRSLGFFSDFVED
ncbi:MAG: DUF1998 domain-containing protein [Clostridia bacterium]|nr:DUF1998 domain-containing protein [Clostridia bacterium]